MHVRNKLIWKETSLQYHIIRMQTYKDIEVMRSKREKWKYMCEQLWEKKPYGAK